LAKTTESRTVSRVLSAQNPASIRITGIPKSTFSDLYYFLLKATWTQVVLLVGVAFILLNALFAVAFVLVGGVHGARPGSFLDVFFFSVQTMGTIGYGALYPDTLGANILVTIEAIAGLLSTAVVTGLAFAKFSRPRARIMFTNRAVISLRDGVPTLMLRVANERANHVAEAQMRVSILRWERTLEGEQVRKIVDLHLMRHQTPAFILTWLVMHVINEQSPLYGMTPEKLKELDIQLVVTVIGHDETFASTIHARYSYSPEQIVLNKRYADVIVPAPGGGRLVDYTRFHNLIDAPPLPEGPLGFTPPKRVEA
jgi:inward rectifier potassium channel